MLNSLNLYIEKEEKKQYFRWSYFKIEEMRYTLSKQKNNKKGIEIWVLRILDTVDDFTGLKSDMLQLEPKAYYSKFVKGFVFEQEPNKTALANLGLIESSEEVKNHPVNEAKAFPPKDWWSKMKVGTTIRRNSRWIDLIFDQASEIDGYEYSDYSMGDTDLSAKGAAAVKKMAAALKDEYKRMSFAKIKKGEGDAFKLRFHSNSFYTIYVDPERLKPELPKKSEFEKAIEGHIEMKRSVSENGDLQQKYVIPMKTDRQKEVLAAIGDPVDGVYNLVDNYDVFPISFQLTALTGDSFNSVDWESLGGGELSSSDGNVIVNKNSGVKVRFPQRIRLDTKAVEKGIELRLYFEKNRKDINYYLNNKFLSIGEFYLAIDPVSLYGLILFDAESGEEIMAISLASAAAGEQKSWDVRAGFNSSGLNIEDAYEIEKWVYNKLKRSISSENSLVSKIEKTNDSNLGIFDMGGDVTISDKSIDQNGDYMQVAFVKKDTGEINWVSKQHEQVPSVNRFVQDFSSSIKASKEKELVKEKVENVSLENRTIVANGEPVSLYVTEDFSGKVIRIQGKLQKYGTKKYAQYKSVPFAEIIPLGKRNPRVYQKSGYDPYYILVLGYDAPDVEVADKVLSDNGDMKVSTWKYSAFDEGWKKDANSIIDPYLEAHPEKLLLKVRKGKYIVKDLPVSIPENTTINEGVNEGISEEITISFDDSSYKTQHSLNEAIRSFVAKTMQKNVLDFTDEEKEFIYKYEGSGGLIKQGADDRGVLSEFYTPELLIKKMWALAYKYGFKGGKLLENSVGVGRFLDYVNFQRDKVVAYEINPVSARICKILHPSADVRLVNTFADHFYGNTEMTRNIYNANYEKDFDLVIGNPPYGEYKDRKMVSEQAKTKINFQQLEFYFIIRSLDCLKSGGLLVYVVPSNLFNANYSSIEREIEARATLVDAYLLPNKTFSNTEVGTSVIVLRKK